MYTVGQPPHLRSSGKCPRAAVQSVSPPPPTGNSPPASCCCSSDWLPRSHTRWGRAPHVPGSAPLLGGSSRAVLLPPLQTHPALLTRSRADGHWARGPALTGVFEGMRFPFFGAYRHRISQFLRKLPNYSRVAAQCHTSHPWKRMQVLGILANAGEHRS